MPGQGQAVRLGVILVELMEQTHGTFGQNFRWARRWTSWRRPWRVWWLRRVWRHASRRGSTPTSTSTSGYAKRGVSDMPRCQRAGCAFLPTMRWIPDCHCLHQVRYRGTAWGEVLRAVWHGDRLSLAPWRDWAPGALRHISEQFDGRVVSVAWQMLGTRLSSTAAHGVRLGYKRFGSTRSPITSCAVESSTKRELPSGPWRATGSCCANATNKIEER
jgi:hypothetical protein